MSCKEASFQVKQGDLTRTHIKDKYHILVHTKDMY